MKEVLERYEYLMVYRLMDGRGLEADDVREMLDGYYKLRKAVEEGSGRFVNRPYEGAENGGPSETPHPSAAPTPSPQGEGQDAMARPEQEPPKMTGQGAKIKNEALTMYDQLRRAGVTRADILEAGQGSFGETELDLMVNRRKVDFTFWQAFHEALTELATRL